MRLNLLRALLLLCFDCCANFDRVLNYKKISTDRSLKIFIFSGYLNIKDATLDEK